MLNNDKDYIKEIITDVDKLPDRCDEINVIERNEEVREVVVTLKHTLATHENGVGLAAPQVGINARIFVINFNGNMRAFINPMYTHTNDIVLSREGCLSLPGKEYLVPRFSQIKIAYQDPQGKVMNNTLVGMSAFVFQHEMDHLEGITLDKIGLEIDKDFDEASEEEKEKIIEMYLESLKRRQELLDNEIENNEELKKMRSSLEFMDKIRKGEVKVERREVSNDQKESIEEKLKEVIEDGNKE